MLIIEAMHQTGSLMNALSSMPMINNSHAIDVENVQPTIVVMAMQCRHQQAPAANVQGQKTEAVAVDGPVLALKGWSSVNQ